MEAAILEAPKIQMARKFKKQRREKIDRVMRVLVEHV